MDAARDTCYCLPLVTQLAKDETEKSFCPMWKSHGIDFFSLSFQQKHSRVVCFLSAQFSVLRKIIKNIINVGDKRGRDFFFQLKIEYTTFLKALLWQKQNKNSSQGMKQYDLCGRFVTIGRLLYVVHTTYVSSQHYIT